MAPPPRSAALAVDPPEFRRDPDPRAVRLVRRGALFVVTSGDGQVGGVFVSRGAAVRFAEREFCVPQGRDLLDETGGS